MCRVVSRSMSVIVLNPGDNRRHRWEGDGIVAQRMSNEKESFPTFRDLSMTWFLDGSSHESFCEPKKLSLSKIVLIIIYSYYKSIFFLKKFSESMKVNKERPRKRATDSAII